MIYIYIYNFFFLKKAFLKIFWINLIHKNVREIGPSNGSNGPNGWN